MMMRRATHEKTRKAAHSNSITQHSQRQSTVCHPPPHVYVPRRRCPVPCVASAAVTHPQRSQVAWLQCLRCLVGDT